MIGRASRSGRIDHLVYAAPDLDAAVDHVEQRFGIRARPGGKHPGVGTHNALLALGDGIYLEVIAPDPEQPAPAGPRPFGIDGLGGPALVGWAIAVDDIDAAITRARAQGYDPGDAIAMERTTPDGTVLRWQLTLNAIGGGPLPFLIAWGDTEHPSRTAPGGLVLESLTIEHPAPDSIAPDLAALGAAPNVSPADEIGLVAHLRGPKGRAELR